MKRIFSRREALRWMSLAAAAVLAACQGRPRATEGIDTPVPPTNTAAHLPDPTSTNPPITSTPDPTPTSQTEVQQQTNTQEVNSMAIVLMTKNISADGLMKVYQALGRKASGRVAVKISSGEPGGHNFLTPGLIAPLVSEVNGTIVEGNTAYGGGRADTASHLKVMEEHGFSAIAPVDILDAEGTLNLPITGGSHLREDVVGSHLANYDFLINLAHFKGHAMGGFGGVIKNMSVGIASSAGKCLIHTAGSSSTSIWGGNQDDFLESMAEAAKGVADFFGENILYINVMNKLSVDCDCDSHPADPTMQDIGILASLDPVALDQASVDLVYAAPDGQDLITRMESRHGIHTLEHAGAIGLGSRQYELVMID